MENGAKPRQGKAAIKNISRHCRSNGNSMGEDTMTRDQIISERDRLFHEEKEAVKRGDYKTALEKSKQCTLLAREYGRTK